MKNATGIEKKGVGIGELDREAMVEGTSQAGLGILIALATLVGVWGIGCLISGMVNSGVMGLLRGWLSAVTGM
ncbi:MAG: hypothetical protein AB1413_07815 [Thermodesulfobacteriota bacterium]